MRSTSSAVLESVKTPFFAADYEAHSLEDRTLLDGSQTPTDPTETTNSATPQVTQPTNPAARPLTGALVSSLVHLTPGMNYTLPGWLGQAPASGTQADVYFAAYVDYVKANPTFDPATAGTGSGTVTAFPGWVGDVPTYDPMAGMSGTPQPEVDAYNSAYAQYLSGQANGGAPSATTARSLTGSQLLAMSSNAQPGTSYILSGWVGTPTTATQQDAYFAAFVDYSESHPSNGMSMGGGMGGTTAFPGWTGSVPDPMTATQTDVDTYNTAYAQYLASQAAAAMAGTFGTGTPGTPTTDTGSPWGSPSDSVAGVSYAATAGLLLTARDAMLADSITALQPIADDTVTISLMRGPAHGDLKGLVGPDTDPLVVGGNGTVHYTSVEDAIAQDGLFTYQANASFSGADGFIYAIQVFDAEGHSRGIVYRTVALQVDAPTTNAPPEAMGLSVQTTQDVPLILNRYDGLIGTGGWDSDSQDILSLDQITGYVGASGNWVDLDQTISDTTTAPLNLAHGTLKVSVAGTVLYTPNAGFVGQEIIGYRLNDGTAESYTGLLSIQVTPADSSSPPAPDVGITTPAPITTDTFTDPTGPTDGPTLIPIDDSDPLLLTATSPEGILAAAQAELAARVQAAKDHLAATVAATEAQKAAAEQAGRDLTDAEAAATGTLQSALADAQAQLAAQRAALDQQLQTSLAALNGQVQSALGDANAQLGQQIAALNSAYNATLAQATAIRDAALAAAVANAPTASDQLASDIASLNAAYADATAQATATRDAGLAAAAQIAAGQTVDGAGFQAVKTNLDNQIAILNNGHDSVVAQAAAARDAALFAINGAEAQLAAQTAALNAAYAAAVAQASDARDAGTAIANAIAAGELTSDADYQAILDVLAQQLADLQVVHDDAVAQATTDHDAAVAAVNASLSQLSAQAASLQDAHDAAVSQAAAVRDASLPDPDANDIYDAAVAAADLALQQGLDDVQTQTAAQTAIGVQADAAYEAAVASSDQALQQNTDAARADAAQQVVAAVSYAYTSAVAFADQTLQQGLSDAQAAADAAIVSAQPSTNSSGNTLTFQVNHDWMGAGVGPMIGFPAATFDGSNQLYGPHISSLDSNPTTQRTVSLWFKADEASLTGRHVLYEEGGTARGLNIYLDNGRLVVVSGFNVFSDESSWAGSFIQLGTVDVNNWHHVALILNGSSTITSNALSAYVDSQFVGAVAGSQIWGHPDPLGIGGTNGSTRLTADNFGEAGAGIGTLDFGDGTSTSPFVGQMADVRIYNTALSGSQVALLGAQQDVAGYQVRYTFADPTDLGADATGLAHAIMAPTTTYPYGFDAQALFGGDTNIPDSPPGTPDTGTGGSTASSDPQTAITNVMAAYSAAVAAADQTLQQSLQSVRTAIASQLVADTTVNYNAAMDTASAALTQGLAQVQMGGDPSAYLANYIQLVNIVADNYQSAMAPAYDALQQGLTDAWARAAQARDAAVSAYDARQMQARADYQNALQPLDAAEAQAVALALGVYSQAVSDAKAAHDASLASAAQAFEDAAQTSEANYETALQTAADAQAQAVAQVLAAYDQAVTPKEMTRQLRVQAARLAHDQDVQQAAEDQQAARAGAIADYRAALAQAQFDLQSATDTATQTYTAQLLAAQLPGAASHAAVLANLLQTRFNLDVEIHGREVALAQQPPTDGTLEDQLQNLYIEGVMRDANAINEANRPAGMDSTQKAQADTNFVTAEQAAVDAFAAARQAANNQLSQALQATQSTYQATVVADDTALAQETQAANSDYAQAIAQDVQAAQDGLAAVDSQFAQDEQAADTALVDATAQARQTWLDAMQSATTGYASQVAQAGSTLADSLQTANDAYIGAATVAQLNCQYALADAGAAFTQDEQALISQFTADITNVEQSFASAQNMATENASSTLLGAETSGAYAEMLMHSYGQQGVQMAHSWLGALSDAGQAWSTGAGQAVSLTTQQLLNAQATLTAFNQAISDHGAGQAAVFVQVQQLAQAATTQFQQAMSAANAVYQNAGVDTTGFSAADTQFQNVVAQLSGAARALTALSTTVPQAQTVRVQALADATGAYADALAQWRSAQSTGVSSGDQAFLAARAQFAEDQVTAMTQWMSDLTASQPDGTPSALWTPLLMPQNGVFDLAALQAAITDAESKPTPSLFPDAGCFTGDTLVETNCGKMRIDQLRLGDRVITAMDGEAQLSETEVDENAWVQVDLTASTGSAVYTLSVLKSQDWLKGRQAGDKIALYLAELDMKGPATITAIKPCPTIQEGEGRVVRMTIKHQHNDSLKLTLSSGETLITTGQHPFWSPERGEFVPARELKMGGLVATRRARVGAMAGGSMQEEDEGLLLITRIEASSAAEVFNIEVEGEHWYFVGEDSVWVHNVCGDGYNELQDAQNVLTPWSYDVNQSVFFSGDDLLTFIPGIQGSSSLLTDDIEGLGFSDDLQNTQWSNAFSNSMFGFDNPTNEWMPSDSSPETRKEIFRKYITRELNARNSKIDQLKWAFDQGIIDVALNAPMSNLGIQPNTISNGLLPLADKIQAQVKKESGDLEAAKRQTALAKKYIEAIKIDTSKSLSEVLNIDSSSGLSVWDQNTIVALTTVAGAAALYYQGKANAKTNFHRDIGNFTASGDIELGASWIPNSFSLATTTFSEKADVTLNPKSDMFLFDGGPKVTSIEVGGFMSESLAGKIDSSGDVKLLGNWGGVGFGFEGKGTQNMKDISVLQNATYTLHLDDSWLQQQTNNPDAHFSPWTFGETFQYDMSKGTYQGGLNVGSTGEIGGILYTPKINANYGNEHGFTWAGSLEAKARVNPQIVRQLGIVTPLYFKGNVNVVGNHVNYGAGFTTER